MYSRSTMPAPRILNTLSREQSLALLLVLFALWCGVSWYWYTCGIHGLCPTTKTSSVMVSEMPVIPLTELAHASVEVAPPAPSNKKAPLIVRTIVGTPHATPASTTPTETPSQEICAPYLIYTLAPGTKRDADVRKLERFLTRVHSARLAEDGMFGPHDRAAVRAYQADRALTKTGSVDTDTLTAINEDACTHRDQLLTQ